MKKSLLFVLVFIFTFSTLYAVPSNLQELRQYEPVILQGGILSDFYGVPVDQIYMYAMDESENKLKLIPFQIDERIRTQLELDLKHTEKVFERHYYASKRVKMNSDGTWIDMVDDGKFDNDDELVFLVGDLGGVAPESAWADVDVENGLRKTVSVHDPSDPQKFAVGYLVHSLQEKEIPAPYNFSYNKENDTVKNSQYTIKMVRPSGLIGDISIQNGVDILDVQKIRLVGLIDVGFAAFTPGLNGLPAFNDRDNFYIFPDTTYLSTTENPRVRLVREVHQTIRAEDFLFSIIGVSFFVTTKFYPYSGTLEGGASLNPEKLKEMFGDTDDIFIQFNLVRQSWDYNENANGMKFYNPGNNGIVVDGAPDADVNRTITSTGPIKEWTMISGDQGTMFTYLVINDTTFEKAELYYHDNKEGGQDDDSYVEGGDTGDGMSYGDTGIKIMDSQSLDLGFSAYFLEKNKDKAFAEQLAYNVENPVVARTLTVDVRDVNDKTLPGEFHLSQNYPNPFNNSTAISFYLPRAGNVHVDIIDLNGRLVKRLLDSNVQPGQHKVIWNGRDASNNSVSTGVYIYRMRTDDYSASKKLLLVK